MSTKELIQAAKARFNYNLQKNQLSEKYNSKLSFANQGGLWTANANLITFLQAFDTPTIVLIDYYQNPVLVERIELLEKASKLYATVTKQWYEEWKSLENNR